MFRVKQIAAALILSLLPTISYAPVVYAAQASSTNYGVSEVNFGSGGSVQSCGTAYCAQQSAGELAVGTAAQAPTASINNTPTADTYINSGTPNTNFGTTNPLRASSVANRSLLKFDTSSIPANAYITSVTLQIYSTNAPGGKYQVHPSLDSWTETGVTWNTQPTWDTTILATSEIALASSTVYIKLPTSSVTRAGNTNFGLDYAPSGMNAFFASREDATNPPRLLVEYGGTGQVKGGGVVTQRSEYLEMDVSATPIDLGLLDTVATKTGTTTFSVHTYPAFGYNVIADGSTPKNKTSGYALAAMTDTRASTLGTEQFGINLRQNTSPAVGSDVQHSPDGTFAFGSPTNGYGAVNRFRYVAGEAIATSPKGTGKSTFTMSVIANVSTTTPGGSYGGRLDLIAVPTF